MREHSCVCHSVRDCLQLLMTPYNSRLMICVSVMPLTSGELSYVRDRKPPAQNSARINIAAHLLHDFWITLYDEYGDRLSYHRDENKKKNAKSLSLDRSPRDVAAHSLSISLRAGSKAAKLITVCGNAERKLRASSRLRLRFINPRKPRVDCGAVQRGDESAFCAYIAI